MSQKRIEFISFEEFKKLYKAEKKPIYKLAYALAFGSGLRISEIVGLEKEVSLCCNVETEKQLIKVEGKKRKKFICSKCKKILELKEVKRKKGEWKIPPLKSEQIDIEKHQIRLDIAKGGKWRITITSPLLKEEHLKLLPLKIPRRTLQGKFERLAKKVLNKKMSFHILRHGFGNYQANNIKTPLPIIQQMMGHSRLDITGIYTKANPEESISMVWKNMGGQ